MSPEATVRKIPLPDFTDRSVQLMAAFVVLVLMGIAYAVYISGKEPDLPKVSQQLDESITVQAEIRQFLVATKSAASATNVLAEEISNLVRGIANARPPAEETRADVPH